VHNEELHNFFSSQNIIKMIQLKRMKWVEDAPCMGKTINVCIILVGKPDRKRPLERYRHRQKDNTKHT
jgi:hypothetical protein